MSKPITREEIFLNSIANGESAELTPITREEIFLAKAGGQDVKTPTPITRKEMFLSKISSSGVKLQEKLIPFINGDETMELTEADLADLTNPIRDDAFSGAQFNSVELPPHITALGKNCFASSRINTIKTYATSLGEACFSNAFTEEHPLDLYLLANEFSELGKRAFNGSGIRYKPAQFKLHFNDSEAYYNFVRTLLQSDDSVMSSTPPKEIYFQDTSVKQLEVPPDITNINKQIFRNCKFTKIKFLGDVTYLTGWAFYGLPLYELDLTACTTVPTLLNPSGFDSGYGDLKTYFKVSSALYDEWISATNWSTLANYIVAV